MNSRIPLQSIISKMLNYFDRIFIWNLYSSFKLYFYKFAEEADGGKGPHSPLRLFLRPAGDITLDLGLVDPIHGQPDKGPPNRQAPERVTFPRVKVKTVDAKYIYAINDHPLSSCSTELIIWPVCDAFLDASEWNKWCYCSRMHKIMCCGHRLSSHWKNGSEIEVNRKKHELVLFEIDAWPIVGDLQDQCRTTNKSGAVDENGHKAWQHDNDLEDIGPDHSFHASLLHTDGSSWLSNASSSFLQRQ